MECALCGAGPHVSGGDGDSSRRVLFMEISC